MGVKYSKNKFSSFSSETSFRFDYLFNNSVNLLSSDYCTYKELFDIIEYEKMDISTLETFKYAEIGNVEKTGEVNPEDLSFSERDELNENLFKKIEKGDIILPKKGDILLSAIRPYLNKNVLIKDEEIYYTKAFIQIRPKINSLIFYYTLRTIFFQNLYAVSRQGKGYPTLKDYDLKSIRFPKNIINSLIKNEKELISKIKPLEEEINELKNNKKQVLDIVNKVFSDEFNFDFEEFNKLKDEKIVYSSLVDFSNNIDCRFGYRFQHKSGKYMMNFLKSKTSKRIKDYVAIPISLGASVSPSQYDEDGEYYYISMATVKKFYFDKEDAKRVSDEYSIQNLNKAVKKNDIIMTRSGMAIGKFALIKKNIKGIFADFTMRIRLENYNYQLAYYYFRSVFFQQLITTNKKGLQNHNIFPSMIQEFPIPDWSIEKQNKICEIITKQIEEQKEIDKKLEEKQTEINALIENAIQTE